MQIAGEAQEKILRISDVSIQHWRRIKSHAGLEHKDSGCIFESCVYSILFQCCMQTSLIFQLFFCASTHLSTTTHVNDFGLGILVGITVSARALGQHEPDEVITCWVSMIRMR
jgi:hypothetical protein